MSKLKIERIGGLAGFGGKNAHVRSRGEMNTDDLSEKEEKAVEDLFATKGKLGKSSTADGFRYKISRETASGPEDIEVGEDMVPNTLKQCVTDEFI